jgi:hypothetical protein
LTWITCCGSLRLLEPILPVVHDLDHGWARHRCHFDEIEPALLGGSDRLVHRDDPYLLAVRTDQPHRTDPDLAIDPHPLFIIVPGQ